MKLVDLASMSVPPLEQAVAISKSGARGQDLKNNKKKNAACTSLKSSSAEPFLKGDDMGPCTCPMRPKLP